MRQYDRNVATKYDDYIVKSANNAGVDPEVLRKLLWIESNFDANAQSPTGPRGIAQFTKATARAMGLRVDNEVDDRLNPYKSIDAAARHLRDLDREAMGDVAKLGLLYNQGQGKLGRPQIDAYNRGDLSGISAEGLKYMELLSGEKPKGIAPITPIGNASFERLADKGGITPTAEPIDFTGGLDTSGSNAGQGDSPIVSLDGINKWYKEPSTPYFLYGEDPEKGIFEGTGQAIESSLKNSMVGQLYQGFTNDYDYTPLAVLNFGNRYQFDDEDWQKIKDSKMNLDYLNVVEKATSKADIDGLIKQALDNQHEDEKLAETGVGAQVIGGLAGALADPLSYVPVVGWTPKAAKGVQLVTRAAGMGVQVGAASAASEVLRTQFAGGEVNYENAFWGGMVMGAGFSALGDVYANYKGIHRGIDTTSSRAEARQKALENNTDDPTKLEVSELDFGDNSYLPHPTEEGAVVLKDGSVLSASNPLNPENIKRFEEVNPDAPKANWGFKWGFLTEVGQIMNESSNETIRALGNMISRPPTGYKGNKGYTGATMSDILAHLRAHNNVHFEKIEPLVTRAIDVELAMTRGITKHEAVNSIGRRIAEHMESGKGSLSEVEQQLKESLQDFFKGKEQSLMHPESYGNPSAKSIMRSSKYMDGNYFPVRYDRGQLNYWRNLLTPEGLQEALVKAYMSSLRNPKIRNAIISYLKEKGDILPDMVEDQINEVILKYANDKAFGIARQDNFVASSKVDEVKEGLVGVENNDYLSARHLFDNSEEIDITLPDGTTRKFSPNELRSFDMMDIIGNYALRVDGDIAIMGSTGKTTRELKDEITALRMKARANDDANMLREVEALERSVLMATGRSRVNAEGLVGEALDGLNNLALVAKGFYIPLMNFSEVSGMFAMGNVGALFRNIPIFKELSQINKRLDPSQIKDLNRAVFGKELSNVYRGSRQNHIDRIYSNTGSKLGAKIVGNFKYGTQELANKAPWIKWIPETTNLMIDTAREGFLGDIAGDIIEGSGELIKKWERPELLRAANITDDQWKGIKDLIAEHMVVDADGRYAFKDLEGLQADRRMFDLWRYGDYISKETIMQPHRLDNQSLKQLNAMGRTAMMFKNFVMKALNARTLHDFYQAINGRSLEKTFSLAISMGLSTAFWMMRTQLLTAGMGDADREAYLEKAYAPETLAYNALTRSSVLSGFGMINNIAGGLGWDTAKMVRTSLYPTAPREALHEQAVGGRDVLREFGGNIMEQIPAADLLANLVAGGANLTEAAMAENYIDRANNLSSFTNNINRVMPNVPMLQQGMIQMWQAAGVPTSK